MSGTVGYVNVERTNDLYSLSLLGWESSLNLYSLTRLWIASFLRIAISGKMSFVLKLRLEFFLFLVVYFVVVYNNVHFIFTVHGCRDTIYLVPFILSRCSLM